MKNLLSTVISFLFIVNLSAQTINQTSQNLIETFVKSNIHIQLEEVDQTIVGNVFSGTFFKLKIGFIETGTGANPCGSDNYINVNGSVVTMIEPIHTDIECPVLMSAIKKNFLMTDENTAKQFEAALDVLYPVEKSEIQNVKHIHNDTQWVFLRGKFFDDYTAFIATTDSKGEITKIDLVLGYSVN